MNTYTVEQFRTDLESPYAWPGVYPRFFITSDGAALCFDSAKENQRSIEESIERKLRDGWQVIACDINWEDPALYCDDTGKRIESAYAEDDAPKA